MPRFVLLRHDCPPSFGKPSHWDLMLEREGALLTWSLAKLPAAWERPLNVRVGEGSAEDEVTAIRLADHRLAYLDYEGALSGDRGQVTRVDRGEYTVIDESADWLRVQISGAELHARMRLPIARGPTASESRPPA